MDPNYLNCESAFGSQQWKQAAISCQKADATIKPWALALDDGHHSEAQVGEVCFYGIQAQYRAGIAMLRTTGYTQAAVDKIIMAYVASRNYRLLYQQSPDEGFVTTEQADVYAQVVGIIEAVVYSWNRSHPTQQIDLNRPLPVN